MTDSPLLGVVLKHPCFSAWKETKTFLPRSKGQRPRGFLSSLFLYKRQYCFLALSPFLPTYWVQILYDACFSIESSRYSLLKSGTVFPFFGYFSKMYFFLSSKYCLGRLLSHWLHFPYFSSNDVH